MNKLKAYYANAAYKIKNAIIGKGRKVGRKYSLTTPFHESAEAYLMSAKVNVSGIAKFDTEFLAGYTPVDSGNLYNSVVLLTGSGTWSLPEGVTNLHVVLIGGGTGGDGGFAGEDGESLVGWVSTSPAEGGMYGDNGVGGKILSVDIDSPSATYSYSCGVGGEGGAISYSHDDNNAGNAGGDTTFGSYSSASGTQDVNGYTDVLSGKVYAASMPTWDYSSGKGTDGGYVTITGTVSENPTTSQVKAFGSSWAYNKLDGRMYGATISPAIIYSIGDEVESIYGSNGGSAIYGSREPGHSVLDGDGGCDANYIPPNPLDYNDNFYGYGGMGGCGGGGGGASGCNKYGGSGEPGKGGFGGRGGDGAPGCILIYY